ncbi:fascin domain-containing protein [Nakamurella sp. GG22]
MLAAGDVVVTKIRLRWDPRTPVHAALVALLAATLILALSAAPRGHDAQMADSIGVAAAATEVVALRAKANDRYVAADNVGKAPLIANRTVIGPWETFDLIHVNSTDVYLRAHANGRFVCAEAAGASALISNRDVAGLWETFQLIKNSDGTASLRARANNKLVTAENAGGAPLIANRTLVGKWEKFDIIALSPLTTPTPTTSTPPTAPIVNLPGQPAITAYGSAAVVTPYAKRGALIIAGRDNYNAQQMKDASAAGATVLIYLDAIINNPYGRYHGLLVNSSLCGPATARWPGSPQANSWGYLQDFRVGSVVQSKLKCVLELMVAENPHMGGFFADDLGSRSWFGGFNWNTWGATNQQAYRAGAIAVAQTFHNVAAMHGLVVMVNGTWTAGSLASTGGGYPNASAHGLSLADGGYIEHHAASELSYWSAYAKGQWGTAAGSVSQGKPFMYVQANDATTRNSYNNAGVFSFLSAQSSYGGSVTPWGNFHATGLPSKVVR